MSSSAGRVQIYRYQVLRLLGKSEDNEVFEAHDPVLDQTVKIYRWIPPADSLNSSLAGLDGCLSAVQEFGAEVFSEAGSLCLVATNDGATRAALNKLRANGLFPGYWADIIPEPAPPPSPLPPPAPPVQPAQKSRWFWMVAVAGIALAGVFVAVGWHDNPAPPGSQSYVPEKPPANPAATPRIETKETPPSPQRERVLPSFDCAKARTADELLICRNSHLAQLDVEMVAAYHHALENLPVNARRELERAHVRWFINYSRTCNASTDDDQRITCITNFLAEHATELKNQVRP